MPQNEILVTYKLVYLENVKLNFKRQVILIYPLINYFTYYYCECITFIYILICLQQHLIEKYTIHMFSVVGWDFFKQKYFKIFLKSYHKPQFSDLSQNITIKETEFSFKFCPPQDSSLFHTDLSNKITFKS